VPLIVLSALMSPKGRARWFGMAAGALVTSVALSLLALGHFVTLPFAARSVGSVMAAWTFHETLAPQLGPEFRFEAPPMREMVVVHSDGTCQPAHYAQKVNDGTKLIVDRAAATGTRPEDARIVVLDFSNPFTFALHAPPPRGTELWWHLGATFNETHAPRADEVFGDVDVVMVPKCAEEPPTRDALLRMYKDTLDGSFEKDGETQLWILFRRKR
jgi:hypothetical protein